MNLEKSCLESVSDKEMREEDELFLCKGLQNRDLLCPEKFIKIKIGEQNSAEARWIRVGIGNQVCARVCVLFCLFCSVFLCVCLFVL